MKVRSHQSLTTLLQNYLMNVSKVTIFFRENEDVDQRGSGIISAWFQSRAIVVLESHLRGSGVITWKTAAYSLEKTEGYEIRNFRNTF